VRVNKKNLANNKIKIFFQINVNSFFEVSKPIAPNHNKLEQNSNASFYLKKAG
jgi:hypothetical protein